MGLFPLLFSSFSGALGAGRCAAINRAEFRRAELCGTSRFARNLRIFTLVLLVYESVYDTREYYHYQHYLVCIQRDILCIIQLYI